MFIGADGNQNATTYGRAQKRGGDFGTLDATSGEANANTAIIAALNAGKTAANAAAMLVQYNLVVAQYKVIYAQATLRYANKMDMALAKNLVFYDYQAEGQAFWRVLVPWVKEANALSAALLDDMFNTVKIPHAANNYNYCAAKTALENALPSVTAADWGTYAEVTGTGSWTGATIVCTTPAVPTGLAGIITNAGTYTPTSHVGASLSYSGAVRATQGGITDLTSAATHERLYNLFVNTGLKGIADVDRTGESDFDKFAAYFGSKTWMSDQFAKTTGSAPSWTATLGAPSARAEIQSKTVQDNIAVMAVLSNLYKASTEDDATLRHSHWDNGAATYMGTTGNLNTVYDRAEKRGGNFGTMQAGSNPAHCVVNKIVVDALKMGQGKAKSAMVTQLNIIREQIKVIYAQSTLRYAAIVAQDLAKDRSYDEHLGEGMIFYHVIAPWVSETDAAGHKLVNDFFHITSGFPPENFNYWSYCAVKRVLENFLGANLRAQLGTLESVDGNRGTIDSWCNQNTVAPPTALPMITTLAGSYIPASDVGSSMAFSDAVRAVLTVLTDTPATPATTIDTTYETTGIKGAADMDRSGEPVWDLYKSSFLGTTSGTWVSDLVKIATTGTAAGFTNGAARAEVIQKSIMDGAAVQLILSDLHNGHQGTTAAHRVFWDRGAAKYLGSVVNGRSSSLYSRANARGRNFGTLDASSNEAKVNHAVIAALTAGSKATTVAARRAEEQKIHTQIKVLYSQAILRYAWIIDRNISAGEEYIEHHAEGFAFWRVIAPLVAPDANDATYIEGIYNPARTPIGSDHYCIIKSVLDKQLLPAADMGTLEDSEDDDCTGKTVPADAAAYLRSTAAVSSAGLANTWAFVSVVSFALTMIMM
jgi:hypothetical protein